MATAFPVAPRESGRVTWSAAIGELVPIPTRAFGAASVVFLIVVVPVVAPRVRLVEAPPIFKVVAVVLKSEAVEVVVVISALVAPLTAMSPPNVAVFVPKKEKEGLVDALPNEMFSDPQR